MRLNGSSFETLTIDLTSVGPRAGIFARPLYWHEDKCDRDRLALSGIWSFVDLERGIFYRKQIGKRATRSAQTPAPPSRLLAHMRRWDRLKLIADCFVEIQRQAGRLGQEGFKSAVALAGLEGKVTPHTLPTRQQPG